MARVEDPIAGGAIGLPQLREWLANDRVAVKPVIDPTGAEPVDAHEIPQHQREAMHLLAPFEVFPYGTLSSRQADGDHTVRYVDPDEGGPPGQTALDNLGPLGRRHHLAKTFGGFTVHQPVMGLFLWRTPTSHWFRVDHRGTAHLGKQYPPVLSLADKFPTPGMTGPEGRFRNLLVRHAAA